MLLKNQSKRIHKYSWDYLHHHLLREITRTFCHGIKLNQEIWVIQQTTAKKLPSISESSGNVDITTGDLFQSAIMETSFLLRLLEVQRHNFHQISAVYMTMQTITMKKISKTMLEESRKEDLWYILEESGITVSMKFRLITKMLISIRKRMSFWEEVLSKMLKMQFLIMLNKELMLYILWEL